MTPMTHRAPGVPGAVLQSDSVRAELICDGFHVHPALIALAVRAKGAGGRHGDHRRHRRVGPAGRIADHARRPAHRRDRPTAELEDGTLAGSVLTMDGAFRTLVRHAGASLVDAARMCATTPAEQLGLRDCGRIAVGATADLVVLDAALRVQATYLAGASGGTRPARADVYDKDRN